MAMKRHFIVLCLGFCLLAATDEFDSRLEKAQSLYNTARFDEALEVLNQINTVNALASPQQIRLYKLMGFTLVAKGYYEKARDAVAKIIELDPNIQFDPEFVPPKMMTIYYNVWKEKCGTYQIQQTDPGLQTIAILDFDNNSIGDDKQIWEAMGKGLAQMLITDLSKLIKLKVVERERIQYLLDELKLERDVAFDQNTAVRIGQQLGVHAMLFGGFAKIDKTVRLDARLIKVETSELIKAEEMTGKAEDFIALEKELALKIAQNLDLEISKHDRKQLKQTENKSLEAALAYSKGLSFLDQKDYKNALKKFREAVSFNPNYTAAQKKIDLIQHLAS
jgi:TolB-like protein